jgi:hypothetical protein
MQLLANWAFCIKDQFQALTESLMNFTEPSAKAKLHPPGWKLVADSPLMVPPGSHCPAKTVTSAPFMLGG